MSDMTKPRTVERTIRKGEVLCFGNRYRLEPMKRIGYEDDPVYDGRLDGRRAWFHHYGDYKPLADCVFLTGFPDARAEFGMEWPGPNCIDGKFVWERWRIVDV